MAPLTAVGIYVTTRIDSMFEFSKMMLPAASFPSMCAAGTTLIRTTDAGVVCVARSAVAVGTSLEYFVPSDSMTTKEVESSALDRGVTHCLGTLELIYAILYTKCKLTLLFCLY